MLPKPERESGQRIYSQKIFDTLGAIKTAKAMGFSLQEIKFLFTEFRAGEEPSQECRSLTKRKIEEIDHLVANAAKMKEILGHGLSCNCTSLGGCYISAPESKTG